MSMYATCHGTEPETSGNIETNTVADVDVSSGKGK